MPEDVTLRWISADLAITRTDEEPLVEADVDQVIDTVVEALERAGYDAFGMAEVREAPEAAILAQIQEIAARLMQAKETR